MTDKGKTAYITGGASGIGKAVAEMLAAKGMNIILADRNAEGLSTASKHIVDTYGVQVAGFEVDVADWESQKQAFVKATTGTRINYVFPIAGIGERRFIKNDPSAPADYYEEPDLTVIDVDLKSVLYTSSLAVQHFRRQQPDEHGFRGKIIAVASICGLYAMPTFPVYSAAKHGVVGFTRTYGQYLPEEGITLNSICPNIVRTSISFPAFYDKAAEAGLLVPLENLVAEFEKLLGADKRSGETIEVGPKGARSVKAPEFMDKESEDSFNMAVDRARHFHLPVAKEA